MNRNNSGKKHYNFRDNLHLYKTFKAKIKRRLFIQVIK